MKSGYDQASEIVDLVIKAWAGNMPLVTIKDRIAERFDHALAKPDAESPQVKSIRSFTVDGIQTEQRLHAIALSVGHDDLADYLLGKIHAYYSILARIDRVIEGEDV